MHIATNLHRSEKIKANLQLFLIECNEHWLQQQTDFENTNKFREKARVRYKIEAKNAKLKNMLGYNPALSHGIKCMHMQGAMVILVANIKRILKLS